MILDRYIARNVLAGVFIVLLGLVCLFFIGDLLVDLDNVGRGDFDYTAALAFVLMRTPGRMYALLPAAALIGCLLGLGQLARGSELTAMRAAGAPVSHLVGAAMKAGVLVIAAGLAVGEWLAPTAERLAHEWRAAAISGRITTASGSGFWARDGRRFLHFGRVLPNGELRDLRMFEFNEAGRLESAWRAGRATPLAAPATPAAPAGAEAPAGAAAATTVAADGGGRDGADRRAGYWRLEEVELSRLWSDGVDTRRVESILRRLPAGANRLNRLTARPSWLTLPEIVSYMRYLRQNGLRTAHYDAALWGRILAPFSTAAMLFTAVVLVLGPLRRAGFGVRIVVGSGFGIGFHIVQKVVTQMGVVYDWLAPVAAAAPVAALGLLGWWWLRRATA